MARFFRTILSVVFVLGLAPMATAQTGIEPWPEPAFCDPALNAGNDDAEEDGDEEDLGTRVRRYDLEEVQVLKSERDIMNALYEEAWDLNTMAPEPRAELCESEPSYVVNWAQLLGTNEDGEIVAVAKGFFQFRKDGSFQFVYARRPYTGTWSVSDLRMTLRADWLNDGVPIVLPVEKVWTPVEVTYADGEVESYTEETTRVGWFRFMRIATTVKGASQDCACAAR